MYPMGHDAYGVPLGTVSPGDVIERDEAPDADWVPYEAGDGTPGPDTGGQDETGETGTEQDDDTAGVTGSEES